MSKNQDKPSDNEGTKHTREVYNKFKEQNTFVDLLERPWLHSQIFYVK